MSKIVIELQRDSLDASIKVEDLLRKALAVSIKIGIPEMEKWLDLELNGYNPKDNIPEYRKVSGVIKAFNPYQGWIPVIFDDEELRIAASTQNNIQPIGEISKLAGHDNLRSIVSSDLKKSLYKQNGVTCDVQLFMSPTSMVGILESVRNIVLKWTLELEKNGIFGEDMSFKARESRYTVVTNIGVMNNSQIQQFSDNSKQEINLELLDTLLAKADEFALESKLTKDQKDELRTEISTIQLQKSSPKPKMIIIKEALKTIRNIAEGMTGSIIAAELLSIIMKFGTS